MSDIVWCDIGGHPFSAAEPGRKFWTESGNEYGQNQSQARLDACKDHADFKARMPEFLGAPAGRGAIETGLKRKKAQEAADKGYDPDYVAWLEAQADKPLPDGT